MLSAKLGPECLTLSYHLSLCSSGTGKKEEVHILMKFYKNGRTGLVGNLQQQDMQPVPVIYSPLMSLNSPGYFVVFGTRSL